MRDLGGEPFAIGTGRLTEKPESQPMHTSLRAALVYLLVALAIHAARDRPETTGSIPHASIPGTSATIGPATGPLSIPNAALEPVGWGDLDGWTSDDHAAGFATFNASCRSIVRAMALRADTAASSARAVRPVRAALEEVCVRAVRAGGLGAEAARRFFETNFVPVRIRKLGDTAGFVTGYYEPIVDGSRFPTREFTVPLYRRPNDLVAPGAADGGPFPNSGPVFRRTPTGKLVPYYDRGEIEDGALDGRHLEICWLRTAAEALSIQMEGSGRIRLEDGSILRINYDAHNGYSYVPIGRVLIERHLLQREEGSTQRVRQWMHDNPEGAREVRRQNRQVVFFRIVGLDDDTETIGGQGVPLSPGRSIAVDKALHVYGTPFFIEADLPLASPVSPSPFRRIMVAQDTGSAIVGPARADLYFGAGIEAGQVADRIRQDGRFTMLLPRELDPSVAGARMPLPPVKALPAEVVTRTLHAPASLAVPGEYAARDAVGRETIRRADVSPASQPQRDFAQPSRRANPAR
jgi:membrane-bound lytic murein transglycosylase A